MALISANFASSILLLASLSAVHVGRCSRILGVFPITSVSHQVVYRAVMVELARRGHELMVITPDPIKDPQLANYTEIDVSFMYEHWRKTFDFAGRRENDKTPYEYAVAANEFGLRWSEMLLSHEPVKKLVSPKNTGEHFDLVFVEWFLTPAMYAFAHRFSAPMIGIVSHPLPFGYSHDSVGNPTNPSYIPEVYLPYSDKMTFFERIDNLLYAMRIRHFFYNTIIPRNQEIVNRYFGPSSPSILGLHCNVSMLFESFDPSFHPPRPEVPAIVHISGLHMKPPKQLPQDLQQYLDSAPKGVVYFSLGTNVRSDKLNSEKIQAFLEAFKELEGYRVLWKYESDSLPRLPANVRVQKWMPQADILRHSKVKVFIMQGGMQSTEEAIHSGVPLIGIPFFADQDYNVKRIVDKKIGLKLDVNEISKETILHTLRTILDSKSFYENVHHLSEIMKDKQTTPMERAIWWTEYVLRHKGAAHLRTAAVDMPWYQYLLLDVLAFCFVISLVAILILWKIAMLLYSKLLVFEKQKVKKS